MSTTLTKFLKCKVPLMQAPMAGVTTPLLVSQVSNHGGIGSHGCGMLSPDQIATDIKQIKANLSSNDLSFNINLFAPAPPLPNNISSKISQIKQNSHSVTNLSKIVCFINDCHKDLNIDPIDTSDANLAKYAAPADYTFDDQFNTVIEGGSPIFSWTFGSITSEQSEKLKKLGIVRIGTVTNTKEAEYFVDNNLVDIICAQGAEAGAHRATFLDDNFSNSMIGLVSLIPSVDDKINGSRGKKYKMPIIAAGGMMDSRGIDASMRLGASGVGLGTLFLNCEETQLNEGYLKAIRGEMNKSEFEFEATCSNIRLIEEITGKPAVGLSNKYLIDIEKYFSKNENKDVLIPRYPVMNKMTTTMRNGAKKNNNPNYMSLWCGKGIEMLKKYPKRITVENLMQQLLVGFDKYNF